MYIIIHTSKYVSQLESIQQHGACWVCGSRWNLDTRSWSKSSGSCLQEVKWPSLHSRRSHFPASLVHADDILHERISISFNKHFQFSNANTRSHPLTLSIPSNPYRHSFSVNIPFLWNSIPHYILQLSNRLAFHSALCHFLVV